MPRQNRVDPFGRILAHPARGLLMGNRGCLHDEAGRIVRTSDCSAWISCVPHLVGTRRRLMQPGCYTELFFLDEATALAAGHRPCGSCRPDALAAFKAAWQRAFRLAYLPKVAEIDETLRAAAGPHWLETMALPDGTMIAVGEQPLLRWRQQWLAWTRTGYERPSFAVPTTALLLASAPVLAILRAGYRPLIHPSADRAASLTRRALSAASERPAAAAAADGHVAASASVDRSQ